MVMPGKFDAAEMPGLDAFDEEFGQDPVAIQRKQRRKTRVRFWTFFSVALGAGVISVLALAWSAADGRLRLELQSAVVAPIIPANPRRFGGRNRSPASSGGGAKERNHEAQGRAEANGSSHRSLKGG
jgi:hypothetical protein